jgi:hypothetical protein
MFKPFDSDYPMETLWFWLSCLSPLILIFMFNPFDSGYPMFALWFWLSCLSPLILTILIYFKENVDIKFSAQGAFVD